MNQFNYIVIEGVIGAGKTALSNIIGSKYGGQMVLEEFEDNPFLPKFYNDRVRYAFQTQLAFLASRFQQKQRLNNFDLFHDMIVSDYLFEKDRLFARINLSHDEMALYDKIYNIMIEKTARPDLVVYLQSSVDRLMVNIEKRGRSYEKNITRQYLEELNNAYNHFFYHYTRAPLIIINSSELDFVNNAEHFEFIEENIFHREIRHAVTHINPG